MIRSLVNVKYSSGLNQETKEVENMEDAAFFCLCLYLIQFFVCLASVFLVNYDVCALVSGIVYPPHDEKILDKVILYESHEWF